MAREFPIHNGRMTTDLDANGHRIKNLPPGSGFTQVQSDWGQTDTTAPDFIKNKPTIPAPVSVDATLTQQGAAADAKVVGDALRGGFTEWEYHDLPEGCVITSIIYDDGEWVVTSSGWSVSVDEAGEDALELSMFCTRDTEPYDTAFATATRHAFPPTKTSQLVNDGDGTNAFVKTNDTRLSDARTPTAHTHAMADVTELNAALVQKASLSDLPYALVTPGEWEFSGVPSGVTVVNFEPDGSGNWYLSLSDGDYGIVEVGENILSVEIVTNNRVAITATRASLPGHLLDRAGNRVVVTGDTTLTLPAANPGHIRDFLVRLEISGSTVPTITFAAPTGETITYETDGDEFPVPDEAGTWLYSFTEDCVAHTFAVSLKKVNVVAQGGS